jgi:tellurite methyltransferase
MKTDTPHLAWNRWATPHGRADWLVPEPDAAAFAARLAASGARKVLDLGSASAGMRLPMPGSGWK